MINTGQWVGVAMKLGDIVFLDLTEAALHVEEGKWLKHELTGCMLISQPRRSAEAW